MSDVQLRVGIAQISSTVGDTDANLSQHLDLMNKAQGEKLDVLVFPELSLSGYPVGSADFHRCALTARSESIARIAAKCRGLTAIVGLLEENVAAQFYNSCYVLRDGEVRTILVV